MPRLFEPVEDDKAIMCACGDEQCYTAALVIDDTMFVFEDYSDSLSDIIEVTLPNGYALCQTKAEMPKADWSQAPDWANWWAVDADGQWFWHQVEPIMHQTVSACRWDVGCLNGIPQGDFVFGGHVDIPLGVDWRTLKQRRPEVTA